MIKEKNAAILICLLWQGKNVSMRICVVVTMVVKLKRAGPQARKREHILCSMTGHGQCVFARGIQRRMKWMALAMRAWPWGKSCHTWRTQARSKGVFWFLLLKGGGRREREPSCCCNAHFCRDGSTSIDASCQADEYQAVQPATPVQYRIGGLAIQSEVLFSSHSSTSNSQKF